MLNTAKFFSTLASTTVLIGVVNAFTGTVVAIPPTLVGSAACCTPVTLHCTHPFYLVGHRRPLKLKFLDKNKTITALYTATYNGAGGPDNMALSPAAFAGLEDIPSDTSLSPVTWSFV
ncbi:hypothetical protein B0H13DRAFT_2020137 [Mycena leptocephala]|nr:hypothetical protein B0H13DRAFT_2020137 [Mycena leptocephala]